MNDDLTLTDRDLCLTRKDLPDRRGIDLVKDQELTEVRKKRRSTIAVDGRSINPDTGSPPYNPTPESRSVASALASFNIPKRQIALYIGISEKTLNNYHGVDMEMGRVEMIARCGSRALGKALNGDSKMLQFILECIGGWKKASEEVSSAAKEEMMMELRKLRNEMDEKNRKEY